MKNSYYVNVMETYTQHVNKLCRTAPVTIKHPSDMTDKIKRRVYPRGKAFRRYLDQKKAWMGGRSCSRPYFEIGYGKYVEMAARDHWAKVLSKPRPRAVHETKDLSFPTMGEVSFANTLGTVVRHQPLLAASTLVGSATRLQKEVHGNIYLTRESSFEGTDHKSRQDALDNIQKAVIEKLMKGGDDSES